MNSTRRIGGPGKCGICISRVKLRRASLPRQLKGGIRLMVRQKTRNWDVTEVHVGMQREWMRVPNMFMKFQRQDIQNAGQLSRQELYKSNFTSERLATSTWQKVMF